jgi:hypothetical protein
VNSAHGTVAFPICRAAVEVARVCGWGGGTVNMHEQSRSIVVLTCGDVWDRRIGEV